METFHLISSLDFCMESGQRMEQGCLARGFPGLRWEGALVRWWPGVSVGEPAVLCLLPAAGSHCSAGERAAQLWHVARQLQPWKWWNIRVPFKRSLKAWFRKRPRPLSLVPAVQAVPAAAPFSPDRAPVPPRAQKPPDFPPASLYLQPFTPAYTCANIVL